MYFDFGIEVVIGFLSKVAVFYQIVGKSTSKIFSYLPLNSHPVCHFYSGTSSLPSYFGREAACQTTLKFIGVGSPVRFFY
jgi:hypothetical protein